jgi:hypothetical protein
MTDNLAAEPHIESVWIDHGAGFRKNVPRFRQQHAHALVGEYVERSFMDGSDLILGEQAYRLEWIDEPSVVGLAEWWSDGISLRGPTGPPLRPDGAFTHGAQARRRSRIGPGRCCRRRDRSSSALLYCFYVHTGLHGNVTAYRWYRLKKTGAGLIDGGSDPVEVEFKIDA